jgi:WD40 repeat protein
LKENDFFPSQAVFSRDGKQIISASRKDPRILIWDAESRAVMPGPAWHQSGSTKFMILSPDGSRLAFTPSAEETVVILWDLAESETPPSHLEDPSFQHAAFSGDGNKLVTGSFDYTRTWDLRTSTNTATSSTQFGAIFPVAFSPDGGRIAFVTEVTQHIKILDAETASLEHGPHSEHSNLTRAKINSLAFSPDGSHIALGFADAKIMLMDVETGDIKAHFQGHQNAINTLVFSRDGTRLYSGSQDGTVRVWDSKSGRHLSRPLKHEGIIFSVALSPDETKIVSCCHDKAVHVWGL